MDTLRFNDILLGCFLVVDLNYPDQLHNLCNDYPLAGKKIEVANNFPLGEIKKPIPNLGNKRKYKVHFKTWDFVWGYTTKKFKQFKQEPFLKSYIERNTELQREVEKGNKIKKQNAKLRNNAIFGNSTENPMNKVDVNTVTTRKQYLKW